MPDETITKFFERPILNSPYEPPSAHWRLDENGLPTLGVAEGRRVASYITPVPRPRRRTAATPMFVMDEGRGLSTAEQEYEKVATTINEIRRHVDAWRSLPNERDWHVTPETAKLLKHWRHHQFSQYRPFFCQVEAVETVIWLTEVAPKLGVTGGQYLKNLREANQEANPELFRIALKLATGAGKTTVMAMIIAWQTVNAVRHPNSQRFTRGFLVVTPGITIKDRLRVLQPNDPDSYYQERELVPPDMLADLTKARIVITNYHAFKLKDQLDLSSGGRALLQGRGPALASLETKGQMVNRVMQPLTGIKNVLVLNDEGHHCYRHKQGDSEEQDLKVEEREEAKKNEEAARLWITGLEMVKRVLGVRQVIDLSATPFFLRGSGYAEGTLFPWTVNDFSLMDAIECGIVKLPRVPVADNIPRNDMPTFRDLWKHIGASMPKAGRSKSAALDPAQLPTKLLTALDALYGHYRKVFDVWRSEPVPGEEDVPPCFIIVCNNTAASKLVYDYVAGYDPGGGRPVVPGKLDLFSNFDRDGTPFPRPRTLLIDSTQLESGEGLDAEFRQIAREQIQRFLRERTQRTGEQVKAESLSYEELLREMMNTVGKPGRLGASIRCVVSVSMLTEGWDANTVTHVLGVRAFGTQLLCEQVVGRALRRQFYNLNDEGRFEVEYADVLGIPFDFTATPVVTGPGNRRRVITVRAVSPERDHLEIRFPRVHGYRVELPREELSARFTDDSVLWLTPDLVGPTVTRNEGIIGEPLDLTVEHVGEIRRSTLLYRLTGRFLETKWQDPDGEPKHHLFGRVKGIVDQWLTECLRCSGGTQPAQLLYRELADMACERIAAAITRGNMEDRPVKAVLDPFTPAGSTIHVNFTTAKQDLWTPDAAKCHLNLLVLDSNWEGEFCRVVEAHPRVRAYVKNHNLGLEVPYRMGGDTRTYLPDFIVQVDDGREDLLNVVVEIKGYKGENARVKKEALETMWVPGVNNLGGFGRWVSAEFTEVYEFERAFNDLVEQAVAQAAAFDRDNAGGGPHAQETVGSQAQAR